MTLQLSNAALARLPPAVQGPVYDRTRITPGILHIGPGNFHRAHQAWYLHRLMQQGEAMDWGIVAAGVRPADRGRRDRLAAQDYLTTLIELAPPRSSPGESPAGAPAAGPAVEIVGSMIDFVPVESGHAALIARMADPAIRIVSLTVTEGGYYIDPATQDFHAGHPDIRHDAANPDRPRTAFGAMIAALKHRRAAGAGPFTGQSCDNLQGNGAVLGRTILALARMGDPGLADWIEAHCTFPNAMVDCIVPATGPAALQAARRAGIVDAMPVTHENYRQWVIEDNFCAGRPAWDRAGALFTTDVRGHERMKIRILNGGHQLIASAGEILAIDLVSDCMAHPLIGGYFRKVAATEIAPLVAAVPGLTALAFVDVVARRFSNPAIADTVRRVAFDGASRQTGFLLPTLRDALAAGGRMDGLALGQALWARMCAGQREDGSRIEPNDPRWDSLSAAAAAARSNPQAWLAQPGLYGDLAGHERFRTRFAYWLAMLWQRGVEAALRSFLAD